MCTDKEALQDGFNTFCDSCKMLMSCRCKTNHSAINHVSLDEGLSSPEFLFDLNSECVNAGENVQPPLPTPFKWLILVRQRDTALKKHFGQF